MAGNLMAMAGGGYDYEESVEGGYDPSYVPDPEKSFVLHLYQHIREKNVYEIHQMYETSFHTLSDRMFKDTLWPSIEAIAQYVDNDHLTACSTARCGIITSMLGYLPLLSNGLILGITTAVSFRHVFSISISW